MEVSFVEILMDCIMEGVMIPKVQIERAVGPILSMFLEDVLTETFRDDPDLSGSLAMICPEFPLKKPGNKQSTNIDWLMYNTERKQLLFVELKTSDTSVDATQNAIYLVKQETIRNNGGSFLIEDMEQLMGSSTESGKYRYLLEKKVAPFRTEIASCSDARIVYLVPKSIEHKVKGRADRVLSFATLSKFNPGPFAKEWSIIQSQLCALDDSSRRLRNQQAAPTSENISVSNFADRFDFPAIVNLCKIRGDSIVVGFSGGEKALAATLITSLEKRKFKWDNAKGGTGIKKQSNWISGSIFSKIIDKKKSLPN